MSQNNKFTNFRINNGYQNNFPSYVGGVPISDIRAVASQMERASKLLGNKYLTPLEIIAFGSTCRISEESMQKCLDAMSSEQVGYVEIGKAVKENDKVVFNYILTPKGKELIGRFLDLHADSQDRLLIGKMKDNGSHFNQASRKGFKAKHL